jgi:hypothetical protein
MAEAVLFREHGLMVAQGDFALINKKCLRRIPKVSFG